MSHPADVMALSSHATVIEVDVVLHCGAGGRGCRRVRVAGARVRQLRQRAVERRGGRRPGPPARRAPAVRRRGRRQDPARQPQCSDGIDNDGDGKIDYDDPECVGGLDNDESSFATGIPGDNVDACKQDCFFDGNSGMGDDGCDVAAQVRSADHQRLVPVRPGLRHVSTRRVLGVVVAVADVHRQLPEAGAERLRLLRLLRRPGRVDADPPGRRPAPRRTSAIRRSARACTQVTQCMTPCGHCDYCIGKETLPADCTHRRRHALHLPDRLHRVRHSTASIPTHVPDRHDLRDRLLPAHRSVIVRPTTEPTDPLRRKDERPMTSTSLVRMFGVALLVAAGCGSNVARRASPGPPATAGRGAGGTTPSGSGGTSAQRHGRDAWGDATGRAERAARPATGGATTASGGTTASGTGGGDGHGGTGGSKVGNPQCSDGIDNDGDGMIDYDDPGVRRPARQRRELVRDRHPGRQHGRLQAGLLLRRQLGRGRRPLRLAAQVRSAERRARSARTTQQYATQHATECSVSASQSQTCIDSCRKLVPNGCDCFGCCVIPGAPTPIRLAATCTAADFGDPAKCPPCTQVTQCSNPCEHCEICIGKPTLPADCTPPTPDAGTDGRRRRPQLRQRLRALRPGHAARRRTAAGRTTAASPAAASRPASSTGRQDSSQAHPAAAGRSDSGPQPLGEAGQPSGRTANPGRTRRVGKWTGSEAAPDTGMRGTSHAPGDQDLGRPAGGGRRRRLRARVRAVPRLRALRPRAHDRPAP